MTEATSAVLARLSHKNRLRGPMPLALEHVLEKPSSTPSAPTHTGSASVGPTTRVGPRLLAGPLSPRPTDSPAPRRSRYDSREIDGLDVVVIGGGLIGMAVARAFAARGREVVVLEAEPHFGAHASSRNSEVIHAGLYYPTDSLKARLCLCGRRLLYDYCSRHEVPHRRVGKLIVAATAEQEGRLAALERQARSNGVDEVRVLTEREVRALEPEILARGGGLYSPETGIVDSHALLRRFKRDAENDGAVALTASPLHSGEVCADGFRLQLADAVQTQARCRLLINAAGLFAPQVARSLRGVPEHTLPRAYFAKGHYFALAGPSPFRHLVYPLPEPGGLGIHVTLDLAGQARFGPDVTWVDGADYTFDESRRDVFLAAIRAYYPGVRPEALRPGYTGIRAKLVPSGAAAADFRIDGPEVHGLPLVNLFGIESPGLTASLAIAEYVVGLV